MQQATQVALMRRIFGFFAEHATEMGSEPYVNRVSTYTSAAQLEREARVLFRGFPLFVGLSCDAPEPGAYLTHRDGGVPILVVRAKSGELNAFVALCRHRGAELVTESGRGDGRFVCPYHGWTYDDQGRLTAQPCRQGFAGHADGSLDLTPLPVAERYGMIFVRPRPGEAIDVDAHLGGAQTELAAFRFEQLTAFARHESEHAMNWKLVVDTFLEAYHVPTLHEATLSRMILGTPAAWDGFGHGGRLVAVRRSILDDRDKPEAEWNLLRHAVILYHLFPNTILIYQVDHVEVAQAYPVGSDPNRSKIVFTLYVPASAAGEKARRHFQANLDLLLAATEKEDFRVGEGMQRGFLSGMHETVVYGRNEPGLAHFHRMLGEALAGDARMSAAP